MQAFQSKSAVPQQMHDCFLTVCIIEYTLVIGYDEIFALKQIPGIYSVIGHQPNDITFASVDPPTLTA